MGVGAPESTAKISIFIQIGIRIWGIQIQILVVLALARILANVADEFGARFFGSPSASPTPPSSQTYNS